MTLRLFTALYIGLIVGMFVLTWLAALLVWRIGRIEQRWTAQPEG